MISNDKLAVINEGTIDRLFPEATREEILTILTGHNKAVIKNFIRALGFASAEELDAKLAQLEKGGTANVR